MTDHIMGWICVYCRRVAFVPGQWMDRRSLPPPDALLSHGCCPACYATEIADVERVAAPRADDPSASGRSRGESG